MAILEGWLQAKVWVGEMTRLPHENRQVKGRSDFSSPEFVQQCSHPFCSESRSLESHHIWRRSFLGGAYNHVELWDGTIVGNVTLLCREHHRQITENKAELEYQTVGNIWWAAEDWAQVLSPHPEIIVSASKPLDTPDEPTPGNAGESVTERSRARCSGCESWECADVCITQENPRRTAPVVVHGGKTFHLHTPKEGEECPTCKRKVPAKKKREPAKRRGTITFRVPKDNEDGAEIVDSLLDQIREARGREDHKGWKYFVLVECLYFVVQNLHMVAQDD